MQRIFITLVLISSTLLAQIPNGYYNGATGQSGSTLQQILHDIIDGHQQQSYSSLHIHYYSTDRKPDGTVWDMYSDIPGSDPPYSFNFGGDDQCGNYGSEGDCYNREHSWPKSWFDEGYPMYSDLFHVVPSDGYVNGQRGNYPYGEVSSPSWTSQNGSKKGPNTYPGYSGTVFEPIDAYKGDFARAYFYMSTRYLNEDSGWSGSPMVDGAQLEVWALNMMMDWHHNDPVSQKEIDRNDAVHDIQQNRNPYIDHPEYADLIWGEPVILPDAPTNLISSNVTETALDLNWTDNASDESGFYLYQNGSRIATLGPNVTAYNVSGLLPASTYSFGVAAFNGDGESPRASLNVSTLGGGGSTVNHFVESFETWIGSGSTYFDGDIQLSSGTWNVYKAGNYTLGDPPYNGDYTIAINDDTQGAHITTPAVNTLGNISFYYYQRNGDSSDEFQVQRSVSGGAFETLVTQSYNVGTTYTLFSLDVEDSSESIRIRVLNDNQTGHLIIDDFTVTAYDPVSIEKDLMGIPENLSLFPAYPNPFNPEVTLNFQVIANAGNVRLQVYNIQGELLATPLQNDFSEGSYSVKWDGTSQQGEALPSGIYLIKLSNSSESLFQRVTLIR